MITLSFSDLLLTLLTFCALVVTVGLVFVIQSVRQTLAELRQTLRETRRLAARVDGVVTDVGTVTTEVSRLGAPALRLMQSFVGPMRHLLAFIAGLRAASAALTRHRDRSGAGETVQKPAA